MSAFSTRYGLATWQTTDDAGGVAGEKTTTATSYNGSGLDPQNGLAISTTADPSGIAVTISTSYELPAETTYLRATSPALSSGTLSDATKSTSTSYYQLWRDNRRRRCQNLLGPKHELEHSIGTRLATMGAARHSPHGHSEREEFPMGKFLHCHRCWQIRKHEHDVCTVCGTRWRLPS